MDDPENAGSNTVARVARIVEAIRETLHPLAGDRELNPADFIAALAAVQERVERVVRQAAARRYVPEEEVDKAITAARNFGVVLDRAVYASRAGAPPAAAPAPVPLPPPDLPESGADWELAGMMADLAIDKIAASIKKPEGEQ